MITMLAELGIIAPIKSDCTNCAYCRKEVWTLNEGRNTELVHTSCCKNVWAFVETDGEVYECHAYEEE